MMKKDNLNRMVGFETKEGKVLSEWSKSPILKMKPKKIDIVSINLKVKILQLNFVTKIGIRNKISYKVSGTQSSAWELFSRIG
jgi:hypothetical protein